MTNIEFAVDDCAGREHIFKTFDAAAGFAIAVGASRGETVAIDVLCYDEESADAFGCGDEYREDPEASVTQRIEIKVNVFGRIA